MLYILVTWINIPMIEWSEYLENKENDVQNNEKFVEKRKAGAAEIEHKATVKGGYAQLTSWHFAAKAAPYKESEKAVKDGASVSFFEKKYKETMDRLHKIDFHSQKDFQKIMGELEVYGEVLIQIKTGGTY